MFKPAYNLKGCITAPAAALANVLQIDAASWAYLNTLLAVDDWTYMKLGTAPTSEIIKIIGLASNTAIVTRGLDGTPPTAFSEGTEFEFALGPSAVVDIIAANPVVATALSITVDEPLHIEQIAVNQFHITSDVLALTSADGTITVTGTYPTLSIDTNSAAAGCCG